jgi:hypothetical protein
MSSDKNPGEQFALTILIVVVLGLLCAWLASCAPATRAARPATVVDHITLDAPIAAFVGSAIRLRCLVPEALGPGWIRLGLEGHTFRGPMAIEHVENLLLIEHLSCGTWQAVCVVQTPAGIQHEARIVEVHGAGCDGMSPAEVSGR